MPRSPVPPGTVEKGYLAYTAPATRMKLRRQDEATPSAREAANQGCHDHLESSASSTKGQNISRILRLPAELRIMILTEVLRVKPVELELPNFDLMEFRVTQPRVVNLARIPRSTQKSHSVLAVLEVCRTFYAEAESIFYRVNWLRVSNPTMLYYFLRDLPRRRRGMLRRLRIGGLGFHYTGWQLTRRAFCLLLLYQSLEAVDIELAWDSINLIGYNGPDYSLTLHALLDWQDVIRFRDRRWKKIPPRPSFRSMEGGQSDESPPCQLRRAMLHLVDHRRFYRISVHIVGAKFMLSSEHYKTLGGLAQKMWARKYFDLKCEWDWQIRRAASGFDFLPLVR
jgi:hypothetical protein